ncbi:hypothetical protein BX667DRAFT_439000 [Coemansia mojavensis]|nr:hypothetical protein BX667DRAFT_439000 [Coemansia mojavensis]
MTEAAVYKRVYIGGFAHAVTEDEVRGRFKPFGQVEEVDIPQTSNGSETRGFGYVSISITPANWQRCIKVYSGAKWKGGDMRIEEAKEDYMARLRREWEEAKNAEVEPNKKKRKGTEKSDGVLAEDMSLVTVMNIGRYKGWSKNRYGRPVLKHTIIKPNGKPLVHDPAKHKFAVERIFASTEPKSLNELQWEYNPTLAQSDFEAARKLSPNTIAQIKKADERQLKKRRIEDEDEQAYERLLQQCKQTDKDAESEDGGFESDSSGSEILDVDAEEILARQNLNYEPAPFEGADEIASLISKAPTKLDPALQAKLESGVFDSSSEDEADTEPSALAVNNASRASKTHGKLMSFEDELLAKERKRAAEIALQFLDNDSMESAGVLEFADQANLTKSSPQDGISSKLTQSESTSDSSSDNSSSDSSSSDSSSSDSSSDSSSSSETDSTADSDSGNSTSMNTSSGSDSDSDSDEDDSDDPDDESSSESSSEPDSSSDESDSDSDDEDSSESESGGNGSDAMDIDEQPANSTSSLFESASKNNSGSGLFSGSENVNFKFTQVLGLEADEPAAVQEMETDDHLRPVTGGSRIAQPAERNLNANRLPMFFADVDSPMFRRPEAVFQRQKSEEELEEELENTRQDKAREYKNLQRSALRKSRKLYENRSKAPSNQ